VDDGFLSNAGAWLREYFSGESALARIGMVILFIGLAFGAKFAAEKGLFPIEFRLAMIGMGGIALTGLGWWLRDRNRQYSLTLQGGGMAVLYLTLFAASKLYHLMPLATALLGMLVLVGVTVALAIKQDARVLASGATVGGFMAPILASSGSGDHVLLFSYFLILDLGVLAIAWWRRWRELNLIGWVGTYALGTTWGVLSYEPEKFATTEPFLIAFFLVFLAAAVFGTLRPPPKLRGFVDGSLIFGTPIATFLLQRELLVDDSTGLAWSAAGMAALYALAAWITFRRNDDKLDLLARSFSILGLAFITLAIPYALTDQGTAAAWALEGVTIAWLGARQDRRIGRGLGVMMQIAAGAALLWEGVPITVDSFSLGDRVTELILSVSALITALLITRWVEAEEDRELDIPAGIPLLLGWFWWAWLGLREIERHLLGWDLVLGALVFITASALLFRVVATRLRWPAVAAPDRLVIPLLATALVFRLFTEGFNNSPLDDLGWAALPATFAGALAVLRLHDWDERTSAAQHAMLLLSLIFIAWYASYAELVDARVGGAWRELTVGAFALPPAFILMRFGDRLPWPIAAHRDTYGQMAPAILLAVAIFWSVIEVDRSGALAGLAYVPVLSPYDLLQAATIIGAGWWLLRRQQSRGEDLSAARSAVFVLAIASLGWISMVVARTVHAFSGVSYNLRAMHHSLAFQTSLSVTWTLLAAAIVIVGSRRDSRTIWLGGAVLFGLTVAKLFLVDLADTGTMQRIISFIAVGGVMLAAGYLAPLPAATTEEE
jgi:uncharacterized membrane protein